MARLRLLQPYDGRAVGEVIDLPGGVASALVLRRVGVLQDAHPKPAGEVTAAEAAVALPPLTVAVAVPPATRAVRKPRSTAASDASESDASRGRGK